MKRFDLKARDWLQVPERKRTYNERHFSEAAPRYDAATRAMSLFRDASWKRRLVDSLPDHPSPSCVDIGCGTGDVAFRLARRYPAGTVTGIDIAEPMLRIARGRNRNPRLRFLRQDMCAMEVPDGSLDIVTGSYALRNAPELGRVVGEIGRVLKPGGTAAFLEFAKPGTAFLQGPQRLLLRNWCGFWGFLLHGSREIHGYIAESLVGFPDRRELLKIFAARGFSLVASERFFLGMTELLVLRARGPVEAVQNRELHPAEGASIRPSPAESTRSVLFPEDDPDLPVEKLRKFLPGDPFEPRAVGAAPPGLPALHQAAEKDLFAVYHLVDREQTHPPAPFPHGPPRNHRVRPEGKQ